MTRFRELLLWSPWRHAPPEPSVAVRHACEANLLAAAALRHVIDRRAAAALREEEEDEVTSLTRRWDGS